MWPRHRTLPTPAGSSQRCLFRTCNCSWSPQVTAAGSAGADRQRQFREVYTTLSRAMGCDGLTDGDQRRRRDVQRGGRTRRSSTATKRQKISKADYEAKAKKADDESTRLLAVLTQTPAGTSGGGRPVAGAAAWTRERRNRRDHPARRQCPHRQRRQRTVSVERSGDCRIHLHWTGALP